MDDPEWFVRAHLAETPCRESLRPPRPLPDWAVTRMISTYKDDELSGAFYRQISRGLQRAMPTHPVAELRR